jgi:hypothetical protein
MEQLSVLGEAASVTWRSGDRYAKRAGHCVNQGNGWNHSLTLSGIWDGKSCRALALYRKRRLITGYL